MVHSRLVTVARARPSVLEVPAEALDVSSPDSEQSQAAAVTPGRELAQVQRVGFAGQAAVPGQEAGQGQLPLTGEHRAGRDESG